MKSIHRRVIFYTIIGMGGKGKSQSERARRRGRADGVSRLFIFAAAHEAPTGERTAGRVPQPVLLRRNAAPTFKPKMR